MCNNPNLDLININAYTHFQDIEWEWNYDGRNNGMTDRPNPVLPPFSKWGYKNGHFMYGISYEENNAIQWIGVRQAWTQTSQLSQRDQLNYFTNYPSNILRRS